MQPKFTETYEFSTFSDDGIRLWVNDQLVLNNWTDHGPTEDKGSIALVAGQKYAIKMEYYENWGGTVAQLSWASARQTKQIIPQSQLFTANVVGTSGSDSLIGSSGSDVLVGGGGSDNLTGGGGSDRFVYNALSDGVDTITDFNTTQDKLDLGSVFDSLGYLGSTPITDGFLRFTQSGSNTLVQVDQNGLTGGASFSTLVTLNGVAPASLSVGTNVLV